MVGGSAGVLRGGALLGGGGVGGTAVCVVGVVGVHVSLRARVWEKGDGGSGMDMHSWGGSMAANKRARGTWRVPHVAHISTAHPPSSTRIHPRSTFSLRPSRSLPPPRSPLARMASRDDDDVASDAMSSSLTPSASTLGPFAHLPAYHFDFDYRGDSIHQHHPELSALTTQPSYDHAAAYPSPAALVDDFDSYMFPDMEDMPDRPRLSTQHSHLDHHPSVYSSSSELSQQRHTQSRSTTGSSQHPPNPLPDIHWHHVDNALLYTPNGQVLEPDKLYTGYTKYVVVVFVPRQAVELVGLVYGKVAHLLQQAGARLMFVTAWTPTQAATFLGRFERVSPFPGLLVCDPHATLFAAFGFMRSPFKALFSGSKVSAPMRQGVRNAFSTVTYRAQNRDIATTSVSSKRLKCGAVVLPCLRGYAKRPNLLYCNEEAAYTGLGCYLDVLTACGVNDAFVPEIDVAQVYARFNSMRVTSMKAKAADEREANRARAQKVRGSRKHDRRNALKGS